MRTGGEGFELYSTFWMLVGKPMLSTDWIGLPVGLKALGPLKTNLRPVEARHIFLRMDCLNPFHHDGTKRCQKGSSN